MIRQLISFQLAAILLAVLFSPACSLRTMPQETIPLEERAQVYAEAMDNNDMEAIFNMLEPKGREAESGNGSPPKPGGPQFDNVSVGDIDYESPERARVTFRCDLSVMGHDFKQTSCGLNWVLVDGQWYIEYVPFKKSLTDL